MRVVCSNPRRPYLSSQLLGFFIFLLSQFFLVTQFSRCVIIYNKKKKGQKVKAHNLYPHTLSCGGYDELWEKMMQDKMKEVKASQSDSLLISCSTSISTLTS